MPPESRRILGVRVDVITTTETLETVRGWLATGTVGRIATVNVEYVMKARGDKSFATVLETSDLATADSAGILWALRRQGVVLEERVGGSDLIWSLCRLAANSGHSVFLLGGEEGIAPAAAAKLQALYPSLQVGGAYAGSPSPAEEQFIVDLVRQSGADIVFVAFGAPAQDVWLARNLVETGACCGIGVGGTFDYVAGRARRAPYWMRDRGLEWLWRLVRQPRRWKRMLALPAFVWLVWRADRRATRAERKRV